MNIEKEALIIAKNFQGTKMDSYAIALLQEQVGKALQAKQDRILELEEKLREYKWEWESACEREQATNERVKELQKTEESVLNLSHPNIKMLLGENKKLKDALKPFIENYDKYGNHGPFAHGLFKRAKKAIGGGNGND